VAGLVEVGEMGEVRVLDRLVVRGRILTRDEEDDGELVERDYVRNLPAAVGVPTS
jgi:hypothetical protein